LNEEQTEEAADSLTGSRFGTLLTGILFSLSTIAALLYFLGRARIQSMNVTLGVPAGFLQVSPIDYATAGVDVVLPFLVIVAMPVLALAAIHRTVLARRLSKPSYHRAQKIIQRALTIATMLGVLGLGLVTTGLLDQERIGRPLGLVLPIVLAGSAGALAYQLLVSAQTRDRSSKFLITLLACLAVIGVLWAGALYGESLGRRYAQHFATNFPHQPDVMLLTRARLQIVGPGVTVEELPYNDNADYRYCYRGLRYLMENDQYIIYAPVGWTPGIDPLFLIPAETDMRVDTKPGNTTQRQAKCSDR
jgi:hypothetical protein